MTDTIFEQTAQQYEQVAAELEQAIQHLRTTAQHFRDREVPRGCAHAFATYGHMCTADQNLKALAVLHASRAQGPTTPT